MIPYVLFYVWLFSKVVALCCTPSSNINILVAVHPCHAITLDIVRHFNFSSSREGVVLAHLGLIFISLMTTDIENIFMFFIGHSHIFFVKCLFKSFANF